MFTGSRKVWLSRVHFDTVSRVIANLLSEHPGDPNLASLHDEIAIAEQRYAQASVKPIAMSKALGRKEGDIPLTLTAVEANFLSGALYAAGGAPAQGAREALLSGLL